MSFNATYTSSTDISIPATAYNIVVTVRGARGGSSSLSGSGLGPGGEGRAGTFRFKTNNVARTLQIRIGQVGTDSTTTGFFCSAGSSAVGSGGCGGQFGGGQGGGANGVLLDGTLLINAGGGGGGMRDITVIYESNRTVNYPALAGGNGGGWVANSGSFGFSNGAAAVSSGGLENYYNGGGGGGSFGGSAGFRRRSPYANDPSQGGGSRYNSNEVDLLSSFSHTGTPSITVSYETSFVDVTSFTASPNPQNSGNDGVPRYNTTLSWNVSSNIFPLTYTITSGTFSISGSTGSSGNVSVTNLPQSVVGTSSPSSRTYNLSITDGVSTDTASVTVQARNDNTPRNFSIPNQNNVEPNTLTQIFVGQILDIDMITAVTGGPGVQVSTNSTSWSSTIFISNGNNLYVRATSLPFNTNPNGLTNPAEFYVDVGTLRRFFTITTRAPIVNETFNYPNYNTRVPFPDIDTIETAPDHPAQPFIETAPITLDDIELSNPNGVEIKSNNQNIQMRKRISGSTGYTDWVDIRNI